MSLKVFYTSTQDFLPHQLSPPRFDATFRLRYEKHETPIGLCGTNSKSSKRQCQASLDSILRKAISFSDKLIRDDLSAVN